jgi:hypothetical protein
MQLKCSLAYDLCFLCASAVKYINFLKDLIPFHFVTELSGSPQPTLLAYGGKAGVQRWLPLRRGARRSCVY